MNEKVYYKAVRRLGDGRRVSQFVHEPQLLEYRPNGITRAPERSMGIFCYPSLKMALSYIRDNTSNLFTGTVEIHVAHPIGKVTRPNTYAFAVLFPAIKLGRTVRRVQVVNGKLLRSRK